jgi:phosphotriesterase-related protein
MDRVETVRGPIEAEELGPTLVHEHLRTRDEAVHEQWPSAGTAKEDPPHAVAPGDDFDVAVREANAALALGVKTICDPTAMFLGRDIQFMRGVSEQTGLQVVPCTGIYTYDHLPQFLLNRDPDQIAELFIGDIEQGIQDTEIKAGFIKVAADEPGVTENVEKVHRAAARASVRTGAPIMAHTRPASNTGPRQIEVFLEEGVEPAKIQLAHTGDTADLDYIERVLETGVWIGLDRYGLELYLPFEQRQQTTEALLDRGYADRMFLSADSCATIDYFPPSAIEQLVQAGLSKDWTIRIVPDRVLPELRESGMTGEQERTMMVENPVRWLSGHQAAPPRSEGRSP